MREIVMSGPEGDVARLVTGLGVFDRLVKVTFGQPVHAKIDYDLCLHTHLHLTLRPDWKEKVYDKGLAAARRPAGHFSPGAKFLVLDCRSWPAPAGAEAACRAVLAGTSDGATLFGPEIGALVCYAGRWYASEEDDLDRLLERVLCSVQEEMGAQS